MLVRTHFKNANEVLEYFYSEIMERGKLKQGTRYVRNIMFTILMPWCNTITASWRGWKKDYAQLEWEWYKSGDRSPKMVEDRARIWKNMKDDSGYVNSNYGHWWLRNHQLTRMIELLHLEPETRRSIVVHYSPDEVQEYGRDTPCNLVLNFYTEDNKVHMTVFARSIDLIYGFCNDQYCFSKLLMHVTESLNKIDKLGLLNYGCGTLTYMITDLHVYEKHFEMKNKIEPKLLN